MEDATKQTKTTGGNQPATREALLRVGRYSSIPDAMLADEALPPTAKLVWIALVSHLREDAVSAWPSIARLARLTGTSRRTAIRAVADLEARGLVEIQRAAGRSSVYSMFQPVAGTRPGKPTSAKMAPVPKCHRTSANLSPVPVPTWHPKHCIKHSKNNSPPTPRVAGGVRASDSLADADVVDKKAAEKLKSARMQRSSTAEEAVERIDAAWQAVVGIPLGSKYRRRINRGWMRGDQPWLERIDAAAVEGGIAMAERAKGTFGLDWVRKHLEAASTAAVKRTAAKRSHGKAAEEAARQAAEEAARQAEQARAHVEYFATLSDEQREAAREKVRHGRFASKRIDVVETQAALAAWRDGHEETER
jgi:hypothetical protein